MEETKAICPKCGEQSRQMLCGKNRSGTQSYLCGICKKRYTPNPKTRAYSHEVREMALRLLLSGMSARRVGQILGFNKANAYNWCKDAKKNSEIVDK
jgi:transposase-like protein